MYDIPTRKLKIVYKCYTNICYLLKKLRNKLLKYVGSYFIPINIIYH